LATRLPEPVVDRLVAGLVDARMLHRVADAESRVALSRPPEQIPLASLLEIAFQAVDREVGTDQAARWLDQLRTAQKAAAADETLRSLLTGVERPVSPLGVHATRS
jgi:hypothetical protein